jgi:hypothetical protein
LLGLVRRESIRSIVIWTSGAAAARAVGCVAALGSACAPFWAIRAARKQFTSDARASLASTALRLAGVSAYWAMRAEHADAEQLVPPDPPNEASRCVNRCLTVGRQRACLAG